MSMKDAMLNKCKVQPDFLKPIKKDKDDKDAPPPYGYNADQSQNLHVEDLIKKLLTGEPYEPIPHIDVWGEGRIAERNHCTGFQTSYNINLNQGITYGSYKYEGHAIPNLLPVCMYEDTFDVIRNNSVKALTIMGSPIAEEIAKEMARIVTDDGVVIAFGYKPTDTNIKGKKFIDILAEALSARNFKVATTYSLGEIYRQVTLEPVFVFSSVKNPDPIINDEL